MSTHVKEDQPLKYAFIHLNKRNDRGCPWCRMYYISLHSSPVIALRNLPEYDGNTDKVNKKVGSSVWITEWERRGNGDNYQVLQVETGHSYDPNEQNICDTVKNNSTPDIKIQYMLVYTHIDNTECCPDNIKLRISFFETQTDAIDTFKNHIEEIYNNDYDNELIRPHENILESEPIIKSYRNDKVHHFKIVELKKDKKYCINRFSANNWHRFE